MKSIQARLSVGLIAVLVVIGLAFAQLTLWLFEAGLQRYLEVGLRKESENLLVALGRGPDGLQLDERRISAAYQRPFSGYYFRIDFEQGSWRSRSLWDLDMPKPAKPGLEDTHVLGPEGQQLLALRADYRRLGQDISISVAQDYSPVRQGFQRMQQIGLGMGLIALVLVLVLQRITVTRSLRPLERARQQIAQLQQGQRSQL
ncbi:MAG: ATP-binding protein, partial [Pseudomonas sp.]